MIDQKIVVVPFDGGYAKLLFNKIDGEWVCKMSPSLMRDLQAYLNGQEPTEYISPWIDFDLPGDQ